MAPSMVKIREALKEVYDPEIPINIVDLGLIYKLEIEPRSTMLIGISGS